MLTKDSEDNAVKKWTMRCFKRKARMMQSKRWAVGCYIKLKWRCIDLQMNVEIEKRRRRFGRKWNRVLRRRWDMLGDKEGGNQHELRRKLLADSDSARVPLERNEWIRRRSEQPFNRIYDRSVEWKCLAMTRAKWKWSVVAIGSRSNLVVA